MTMNDPVQERLPDLSLGFESRFADQELRNPFVGRGQQTLCTVPTAAYTCRSPANRVALLGAVGQQRGYTSLVLDPVLWMTPG